MYLIKYIKVVLFILPYNVQTDLSWITQWKTTESDKQKINSLILTRRILPMIKTSERQATPGFKAM